MTKADFTAMLDAIGGDEFLVGIMYDNTVFDRFDYPDTPFKRDEYLKTVGETDYIVTPSFLYNKKTGMMDIPSETWHPMDCIQGLVVIKDAKQKVYLDRKQFVECD